MRCCINCFKDIHIRELIRTNRTKGDCDFCGSKQVDAFDIDNDTIISNYIISAVQLYKSSNEENSKKIEEVFRDEWNIFNADSDIIKSIIVELCKNEIKHDDPIFNNKVVLDKQTDQVFQKTEGILGGLSWNEFSSGIKYKNRFHTSFNADALASMLTYLKKEYDINQSFYRGRIAGNKEGFKHDEMKGPGKGKRTAGRINPEEIPVLYLANNEETVIHEIRAHVYDYISIAKFKTNRKIKIVDLSMLTTFSPFPYGDTLELEKYAINLNVLNDLAKEIAKPQRRNDSVLEYVPTQFVAEFIKSQGYDGVEYNSTIVKGGKNLALFDESFVDCEEVKTIEIEKIDYKAK